MKSSKKLLLVFFTFLTLFLNFKNGHCSSVNAFANNSVSGANSSSIKKPGVHPKKRSVINSASKSSNAENDLINEIENLQHSYVSDSYGIRDGQCFTDDSLRRFIADGTTHKIVAGLRNDGDFRGIVESIRKKTPQERASILQKARSFYRKTWSILRLNPNRDSPEALIKGQTTAGSTAERLIAEAVVNLIQQLLAPPVQARSGIN